MNLFVIFLVIPFIVGICTWMACNHFKSGNYFWFGVFGTNAVSLLTIAIASVILHLTS